MTERTDHRSKQEVDAEASESGAATSMRSKAPAVVDYQVLFKLLSTPHMVLDRTLRLVAANDAYVRATGVRLEDILGRPVFDVFPTDPEHPATTRLVHESLA